MKDGDKFRLRGSAGAPFMVTVGRAFTAAEIQQRLDSREWSLLDEVPATPSPPVVLDPAAPGPAADGGSAPAADPSRPAVNDPKAAWISYVVARGLLSVEDAANYTKADLIDMVS